MSWPACKPFKLAFEFRLEFRFDTFSLFFELLLDIIASFSFSSLVGYFALLDFYFRKSYMYSRNSCFSLIVFLVIKKSSSSPGLKTPLPKLRLLHLSCIVFLGGTGNSEWELFPLDKLELNSSLPD